MKVEVDLQMVKSGDELVLKRVPFPHLLPVKLRQWTVNGSKGNTN